MNDILDYIKENYSLGEMNNLQRLLSKIHEEKKNYLESSITLYKFNREYEEFIAGSLSDKYLLSVKISMKHLIKFFGEDKVIETITIKDAETFKVHLIRIAPKGSMVYLRNLKASFNRAVEWGYMTINPFNKIKIRSNQVNKPIFLTRKELELILNHTNRQIMRDIFVFAFNSGCRVGEIVSVKWNNIDFENRIITVGDSQFTTKSRKQRFIPFTDEMECLLKRVMLNSNINFQLIFCKENGFPYCTDYLSKHFKDAARAAGLNEEFHFHSLRHSFGSNLANNGTPLIVIKELMGHSSITTTQIYAHTNLDNLRRGISNLNVT